MPGGRCTEGRANVAWGASRRSGQNQWRCLMPLMSLSHARHKRGAIAVTVCAIAAVAAIGVGLMAAEASVGKTQTLRIFDRPVATTLTETNGTVSNRPPYPSPKP